MTAIFGFDMFDTAPSRNNCDSDLDSARDKASSCAFAPSSFLARRHDKHE
jgi:hypothetical protein